MQLKLHWVFVLICFKLVFFFDVSDTRVKTIYLAEKKYSTAWHNHIYIQILPEGKKKNNNNKKKMVINSTKTFSQTKTKFSVNRTSKSERLNFKDRPKI